MEHPSGWKLTVTSTTGVDCLNVGDTHIECRVISRDASFDYIETVLALLEGGGGRGQAQNCITNTRSPQYVDVGIEAPIRRALCFSYASRVEISSIDINCSTFFTFPLYSLGSILLRQPRYGHLMISTSSFSIVHSLRSLSIDLVATPLHRNVSVATYGPDT